ncbi:unnamed protein product [Cylicocyclus nassatus]|uniref:Zc3h12a-like Ribonuclease NYN domain-containing protein n=1 Tax=Cylicocyclus nassatus TaxID=53992 RepID=A0AA36MEZ8_CYLNA|nr:unnamed protein product [Cylicocyclus nassatus]
MESEKKAKEQSHAIFDSGSRRTEPTFQMVEADWSQYRKVPNTEDKDTKPVTFVGHGFPKAKGSGPDRNSEAEASYREASDSEWDACQALRQRSERSSEQHKSPPKSDLYSRRPKRIQNGAFDAAVPPTSVRARKIQSQDQPVREEVLHEQPAEMVRRDHLIEDGRRPKTAHFTYRNHSASKERNRNRHRRHRQNLSKTDFVQICNALFDSDDEVEEEWNEPGTSNAVSRKTTVEEGYVQIRPTSITSAYIDEFVNAPRGEIVSPYHESPLFDRIPRPGYKDNLDADSHRGIEEYLAHNPLSTGSLSVVVHLFDFPPKLVSRPPDRLLRPVVIDGCAVAGCFDKEYSVHWGKIQDPSKLTWNSFKVLPMKPICLTTAMFLLRGHKVTVLLPNYYTDACVPAMRSKVDDVEALKILINLKIVHFVRQRGMDSVMDTIRREVDKVDALLISSGNSDVRDDFPRNPTFSSEMEASQNSDSAFTKASKRMLTPSFYGRNRDMTMSFGFHTKEDGTWRIVKEEHMCYYEPNFDGDCHINDEGRLCQQLQFEDQVHLLVALKELFEWPSLYRRGISVVLRLNHLATSA